MNLMTTTSVGSPKKTKKLNGLISYQNKMESME